MPYACQRLHLHPLLGWWSSILSRPQNLGKEFGIWAGLFRPKWPRLMSNKEISSKGLSSAGQFNLRSPSAGHGKWQRGSTFHWAIPGVSVLPSWRCPCFPILLTITSTFVLSGTEEAIATLFPKSTPDYRDEAWIIPWTPWGIVCPWPANSLLWSIEGFIAPIFLLQLWVC